MPSGRHDDDQHEHVVVDSDDNIVFWRNSDGEIIIDDESGTIKQLSYLPTEPCAQQLAGQANNMTITKMSNRISNVDTYQLTDNEYLNIVREFIPNAQSVRSKKFFRYDQMLAVLLDATYAKQTHSLLVLFNQVQISPYSYDDIVMDLTDGRDAIPCTTTNQLSRTSYKGHNYYLYRVILQSGGQVLLQGGI